MALRWEKKEFLQFDVKRQAFKNFIQAHKGFVLFVRGLACKDVAYIHVFVCFFSRDQRHIIKAHQRLNDLSVGAMEGYSRYKKKRIP